MTSSNPILRRLWEQSATDERPPHNGKDMGLGLRLHLWPFFLDADLSQPCFGSGKDLRIEPVG